MKNVILFIVILFVQSLVIAQPNINRSLFLKGKKCTKQEIAYFDHVSFGHRIYGVNLVSNKKAISSSSDACFIVMDENFDTVKTYFFGGTGDDRMQHINLLPNGHFLLSGYTQSHDLDLATVSHSYSAGEIWILEVDSIGQIIRQRTFGGSNGSAVFQTIVSSDGYIYMGGNTGATDYDFAHISFGSGDIDAWCAKLDTNLNLKWVKINPGDGTDAVLIVQEINANRFYIGGITNSNNSEMLGSLAKGYSDAWFRMIDSNGNEIWGKRYGGSGHDTPDFGVVDSNTKNLYIGGRTRSNDGDIAYRTGITLIFAPSNYNENIWLEKIDTNGFVLQAKAYGSKTFDVNSPTQIELFENKIWIASSYALGSDDFVSNEYPLSDTLSNSWIGIADTNLNLVCKYEVKSNVFISISDFLIHNSNLYAFGYCGAGPSDTSNTFSCDTALSFNFVLNLSDAPLGIKDLHHSNKKAIAELYPNPSSSDLHIHLLGTNIYDEMYKIEIFDAEGKLMYNRDMNHDIDINISNWQSSMYYVNIENDGMKQTISFIKN